MIEKQKVEQLWARIRLEMEEKGLKFFYENKKKYKLENNMLYIGRLEKEIECVQYWRTIVPSEKQ